MNFFNKKWSKKDGAANTQALSVVAMCAGMTLLLGAVLFISKSTSSSPSIAAILHSSSQTASVYASNAGERWASAMNSFSIDKNGNFVAPTPTAPPCAGTLTNWIVLSGGYYTVSFGLCVPPGVTNSYILGNLVSGGAQQPPCPAGYGISSWIPIGQISWVDSLGLCTQIGVVNVNTYTIVAGINTPGTCPAGNVMVDDYSISSGSWATHITLCTASNPPPPPPLLISAAPSSLSNTGGSSLITYSANGGTNYTACNLGGGVFGSSGTPVGTAGTASTGALNSTTHYWYECYDSYYGWQPRVRTTVTVNVCANGANNYPTCTFCPAGQSGTPPACTCNNGANNPNGTPACNICTPPAVWNGTSCVAASNCVFNGVIIPSGSSVTAYQALSVPYGNSCVWESRLCTNGVLSGSYQYSSCFVQPAPSGSITSLVATPSRVHPGNTATLTWSTSNMVSCDLTSSDAGNPVLSNALSSAGFTTPPITHVEKYTLSCLDATNASYVSQVQVNLIPTVIEI